MIINVGLVSELANDDLLPISRLMRVGAALQTQVERDVSPIWDVRANVSTFFALEDMPTSFWPVIVIEDVKGAAGIHLDDDGRPFGLVEFGNRWSLTASHETLEMLVDPFGNRLEPGPSLRVDQGPVEYLVEVCDPSEDIDYAYEIDSVIVSDFYTPEFFDPVPVQCVRYSFGGHIKRPREVLPGGYLSWRDPNTNEWFQQTFFGSEPEIRSLGVFDGSSSFRTFVDRTAIKEKRQSARATTPDNHQAFLAANGVQRTTYSAQRSRAQRVRKQIDSLRQKFGGQ